MPNRKPHAGDKQPVRPYWLPAATSLESLPPEVQDLFRYVVEPAYEELVINCGDALERSVGTCLVQLLWELGLEQLAAGAAVDPRRLVSAVETLSARRDERLRLIGKKMQVAQMLVKLRELGERLDLPYPGPVS
jgi:hypothetical protein